jgi:RNA polymerase sigma-70 factor (ECF subfamily)
VPLHSVAALATDIAKEDARDAYLVTRVAAGDPEALADLYDRHARPLLSLLQRISGDNTLSEDILHDVFLEAWHQAAAYDPQRGSVRTWLMVRARSRALDRCIKAARDAALAAQAKADNDASKEPDEAVTVDGARVKHMAAGLSDELQQVIELAYFEGLSSSEIAAVLAIPVGTVKSRISRALSTLRMTFGITEGTK